MRDQSDANRTGGAKVEVVRAARRACSRDCRARRQPRRQLTLARPTASVRRNSAASHRRSADPSEHAGSAASFDSGACFGRRTRRIGAGRALYLGFDAPLLGEPINVLLLVEERPHDDFAPMTVEALIADRFVPIDVNDATRALGESGILSMAFAIQPTPRELFGQTLSWLRLTPERRRLASELETEGARRVSQRRVGRAQPRR